MLLRFVAGMLFYFIFHTKVFENWPQYCSPLACQHQFLLWMVALPEFFSPYLQMIGSKNHPRDEGHDHVLEFFGYKKRLGHPVVLHDISRYIVRLHLLWRIARLDAWRQTDQLNELSDGRRSFIPESSYPFVSAILYAIVNSLCKWQDGQGGRKRPIWLNCVGWYLSFLCATGRTWLAKLSKQSHDKACVM